MNAVIYVCHGSRVSEGVNQAVNFIKRFMNYGLAPIQEYCFLEFVSPTIEEAFKSAVDQGASKIVVIPLLLLNAGHAKNDIPDEIKRAASRYHDVEINYSSPLGVHVKMVEALMDRLKETGEYLTGSSLILLAGRGSSDPDVKRDLGLIADMLKANTSAGKVDICFLSAASPSFEERLEGTDLRKYDKVFIMPYLLFTGILMKRIYRVIESHLNRSKCILCNNLGYHPAIEGILLERINNLLKTGNDRE